MSGGSASSWSTLRSHCMHENRETSALTGRDERTSPAGKGRSRTARMNDVEEADRSVVRVNQPNKAEPLAEEVGEERGRTIGVSQGLERFAGLSSPGAAEPQRAVTGEWPSYSWRAPPPVVTSTRREVGAKGPTSLMIVAGCSEFFCAAEKTFSSGWWCTRGGANLGH